MTSAVVGGDDAPDLISLNAHYSPQALAPAKRFDTASPDPDLPAADLALAADLRRRLLFTMGCHSGFNIANYLAGAQPADWPEAAAGDVVSAFVGNTGFGLGLRHYDAFSQKLFKQFASNLASYSMGAALQQAKQEYLADGVTNPYDYKVLAQAVYFGVPDFMIAGAIPPEEPPAGPVPSIDPDTGILTASIDFEQPTASGGPWHRVETVDGDFWRIDGGDQAVVQNRPIQPSRYAIAERPGETAVGVVITGMEMADDETGFDPVLARPVIDDATREPELQFGEVLFPANLAEITNGKHDRVVIVPAQFTSTGFEDGKLVGSERRFERIITDVLYRPAGLLEPDETPPTLSGAEALQGPNATLFKVRVQENESDIVKVIALYRLAGENEFRSLDLIGDGDGNYAAGVAVNEELEFFIQAVNSHGLVGAITNRGRQFVEQEVPVDPDDVITVSFNRTLVNGYYDAPVTVHLESSVGSEILITKDAEDETTYPNDDVLFDTDGNHSMSYRTIGGATGVVAVPVDLLAPSVTIATPAAGTPRYILNENLPSSYDCTDTSLQSCVGTQPNGSPLNTATVTTGTSTRPFSVVGTDAVNRSTPVSHPYKVGYAPASFDCLEGKGHQVTYPLKPEVAYPTSSGVIVPVRFRLCDAAGVSQGPDVVGTVLAPREVLANGELGAAAQGWCQPALGILPTCLPIGSKRQTRFNFKPNENWGFRHDTTNLSPGPHRFRISLNDGTSIDYLLQVP